MDKSRKDKNNNKTCHPDFAKGTSELVSFVTLRPKRSVGDSGSKISNRFRIKFGMTCFENRKAGFTFAELMIALIVISVLSAILYPTIAQFTPNNNKPLFKSAYRAFNEIINEIVNDTPDGELLEEESTDAITPARLCARFCNKANVVMPLNASDTPETDCINACANTENGKQANTITTSNGMRWKFDDYDSDTNMYYIPDPQNGTSGTGAGRFSVPVFKITVDVNASNNDLTQQWPGRSNLATIDRTFISNCTYNTHGKCGVFYFDNSTDANTGIYCHETPTSCTGGGIPNIATSKPPRYENAHLKMQDTFEIYIDVEGKIIGMSPAAWANLENEYGN